MKRRTAIVAVASVGVAPMVAMADEVAGPSPKQEAINVIFDGPPGPQCGRFIEVETDDGRGTSAGEWIKRPNGRWALRIVLNK